MYQESDPHIISVAICTRNRAHLLGRTLDALLSQSIGVATFELLIVDNGSTDQTGEFFRAYEEKFAVARYVIEPALGIANARNRALQEASGHYLVYVDDDAIPDPDWLARLLAPFDEDQPIPACVVGKVELDWEGGRPEWIPANYETLYARYDFGNTPRFLQKGDYLLTTNVAFDRRVLLVLGGFRTDLGHRGNNLLGGEDNDIFNRLVSNGYRVWYEPAARVSHWTPRERQTRRWLIKRLFWDGATQPLLDYGTSCPRSRYLREMLRDLRRVFWITRTRASNLHRPDGRRDLFLEWVRQMGRLYMNGQLLLR